MKAKHEFPAEGVLPLPEVLRVLERAATLPGFTDFDRTQVATISLSTRDPLPDPGTLAGLELEHLAVNGRLPRRGGAPEGLADLLRAADPGITARGGFGVTAEFAWNERPPNRRVRYELGASTDAGRWKMTAVVCGGTSQSEGERREQFRALIDAARLPVTMAEGNDWFRYPDGTPARVHISDPVGPLGFWCNLEGAICGDAARRLEGALRALALPGSLGGRWGAGADYGQTPEQRRELYARVHAAGFPAERHTLYATARLAEPVALGGLARLCSEKQAGSPPRSASSRCPTTRSAAARTTGGYSCAPAPTATA